MPPPVWLEVLEDRTAPAIQFDSVFALNGPGFERVETVANDAAGNLYAAGWFQGTVDFDPGPGTANLTAVGLDDVFVAKYGPGGELVWARRMGGPGPDLARAVAVDGSGNVYTTGTYAGPADFDPDPGSTFNLTGLHGVFVSKLDAGGNFAWAAGVAESPFPNTNVPFDLEVDGSGNVYAGGVFGGTADFDPGPGTANLSSALNGPDGFVVKLTAGGAFADAFRLGADSPFLDRVIGLAVSPAGDLFVSGSFGGTVDFDPGAGTAPLTSAGDIDAFVARYDGSGALTWARRTGGAGPDEAARVALDPQGNVISVGTFDSTGVDFDPGGGSFTLSSALAEAFVWKLDGAGNFAWARKLGGAGKDVGTGLDTDPDGNVYVTGDFQLTADLDPAAGGAYDLTAQGVDSYAVKMTGDSLLVWAFPTGGPGTDVHGGVTVDSAGTVTVAGHFEQTVDFDPGPGTDERTASGPADGYFLRIAQPSFPFATGGNKDLSNGSGEPNRDQANAVAVDAAGNVYV
ncbi:MAG TPA: SBBP repeat-containing protein, partial [Gemmataceae bacterium]